MSIKVIQGGSLTTIQDGGRRHWAHLGLPVSGFMDKNAAHLANWMVGNDLDTELVEVTWTGLEFICQKKCSMAIAGAEFICELDGENITTNQVIQLKVGSHFKMTRLISGVRAYLAFAGGLDVPKIAGSKSTLLAANIGGFMGRALKTGDELLLSGPEIESRSVKKKPNWKKFKAQNIHVVRAMPGPEVHLFNQSTIKQAYSQSYQMTPMFSRQGFRLKSTPIECGNLTDISSSGMVAGTLQVTPDGQTILAMNDAQTTGGYPRILVVNQDQLSQLAQVRPTEHIYFFVT